MSSNVPTSDAKSAGPPPPDVSTILKGKKLAVVFVAMLLSILIALDQTILATALPRIASDFNAFRQQGWVASAFILKQTAFHLIFGQVLRIWPGKYAPLANITLLEIGSAVCGSCKSVNTLIGGLARILLSTLQILAQVTLLETRPKLFGIFGAVTGRVLTASANTGGAFTDHVSWRWCFYINLPVGTVTLVGVSLPPQGGSPSRIGPQQALPEGPSPPDAQDGLAGRRTRSRLRHFVGARTNWGAMTKPWNSAAVIVFFVLSGVRAIALIFWQRHLGDTALVPYGIFKSVSIYAIIAFSFATRFCLLIF